MRRARTNIDTAEVEQDRYLIEADTSHVCRQTSSKAKNLNLSTLSIFSLTYFHIIERHCQHKLLIFLETFYDEIPFDMNFLRVRI